MGNRVVVLVIDGHDMEVLEISTNNAARELKRDLRFVFGTYYPGLRFSVKTNVSGYRPCLEVEWTDGPTYQEVERVAGKFIGLTEEGQPVICQNLFLYEGKAFKYCVDGVLFRRSFSDPEKEHQIIERVYPQQSEEMGNR